MKVNCYGYPDIASKIGFVQILTLERAPESSVLIKGQWRVLGIEITNKHSPFKKTYCEKIFKVGFIFIPYRFNVYIYHFPCYFFMRLVNICG